MWKKGWRKEITLNNPLSEHEGRQRKENFILSILHTRNGLRRPLKSVLIAVACFGHDTLKTETCLGSQWNDFTLPRPNKLLPWQKSWWHSLGNLNPTYGHSSHQLWSKGSWANIPHDLMAKNGPLSTGLRQEHRLEHVVDCSPVGYPSPSCRSENIWNQYLQDCPVLLPPII